MIRQHIFRTILCALIGLGIGIGIVATTKKVYEGRAQLVIGTQASNGARAFPSVMYEEVATILQAGLATNPKTEVQILSGEGVFRAAVDKVATKTGNDELRKSAGELFAMYDVASSSDASAALVKVRAYSPEVATDLANAVADAYNETRQASQRAAVAKALTYLEEQITKTKADLDAAEKKLKDTKEKLDLPEAGANIARLVSYQAELQAQIDAAKADLVALDRSIEETTAEMNKRPKTEPADFSEQKPAVLQNLESQLSGLESQKQTLLVRYYEDSDEIKILNAQMASVKKQIAAYKKSGFEQTIQNTRQDAMRRQFESRLADARVGKQSVQKKISELETLLAAQTAKVNQIPAKALELTELARDVELKESSYKRNRIQYDDLKNRTDTAATPAQITFQAIPDPNPVLPRPTLVYVVSILGGAIFGLLISFAIEAMRLRIYSSTQLQELTGLPVAGVVHDLPGPTARKLLTSVREANPVVSESYRFLAFSAMSNKEGSTKKILITGIDNNAGCSTTAAQFATALAQAGSRVVLADCALDDPTLTKVFGLDQKSGISDILSQTQLPSPDSPIGTDTATPNLRVVGVGTEGRNAIKVASTHNINGMIDALAAQGDILVIDSMPCLASSDAARLVPYVDEVYLVVNAKTANMRNVAAAIDILTLASAASVKVVLTKGNRGEEAVMRQANLASARA